MYHRLNDGQNEVDSSDEETCASLYTTIGSITHKTSDEETCAPQYTTIGSISQKIQQGVDKWNLMMSSQHDKLSSMDCQNLGDCSLPGELFRIVLWNSDLI